MRKDKVITFQRVRVKDDLDEMHVAYQHKGMEGTIQPPARHYGAMGDAVGVKFGKDPTIYYFKPEWLDSVSNPLPEVGDVIEIEAKVVHRSGEQIYVAVGTSEHGAATNWIDRSDVRYVVKRAEKPAEEKKTFRFRGTYSHEEHPPVFHYVTHNGRFFDWAISYFQALPASTPSLKGYQLVGVSLI